MLRGGNVRALDGVRGLAIVCVMLLHFASAYFPGGAIGVDLFFALSAFLITSLMLSELEDRTGQFSFGRFYAKRALRLGPALVLWLVLLAAPTAVISGNVDTILPSTIATLFYFGNYAIAYGWIPVGPEYTHIWSLAIEEQFYLVWPALLVFVLYRLGQRLVVVAVAAWLVVVILTPLTHDAGFLPWGHGVPIVGGIALSAAMHYRVGGRVLVAVGATASGTLAAFTLIAGTLVVGDIVTGQAPYVACGIASVALVGFAAQRADGMLIAVLSSRSMVWLGQRSYGLYLFHRTLAMLLPELSPGLTLTVGFPVLWVVSCLFAEGSYRLVERPVIAAGRARMGRPHRVSLREAGGP